MKQRFVLSMAALAASAQGAAAQDFAIACAKPGDERKIEVVAPGDVGTSCDVRYTRQSGATTPYHADSSPVSYCVNGARSLATNLETAGFTCSETGTTVAAAPVAAPETTPPADDVVEIAAASEAPPPARLNPEEIAPAPDTVLAAAPIPQEAEQSVEAQRSDAILATEMNRILAEPAYETASRGPAQLTAGLSAAPAGASSPTPVGKLIGAAPEASSPAVAVPGQGVTPVAEASSKTFAPRKPEDIIKATLRAQTAAWNEGDLDAFMSTYWKSDALKFVSGSDVSRGWSATLKRYRDLYADEQGLGQLGLDKLDVAMVTDDVAVVTGRFNLVKGDGASSGSFSLVMRQMGGVWRIVHDHSNTDAAVTQ